MHNNDDNNGTAEKILHPANTIATATLSPLQEHVCTVLTVNEALDQIIIRMEAETKSKQDETRRISAKRRSRCTA